MGAAVSGSTLRCGTQASQCRGFSHGRAQALGTQASVFAERGLMRFGSQALEHMGSSGAHQIAAPCQVGSSRTRDQTHVP